MLSKISKEKSGSQKLSDFSQWEERYEFAAATAYIHIE